MKSVQKEADSRVKSAQKEADKKAQTQIREANKKASAAATMYKKELKIDRGNDGLFKYDFPVGALGVQGMKAVSLAAQGEDMSRLPNSKNLQCLYIISDGKKVTLYAGSHNKLQVVKNFRGTTDINVCREPVAENLQNADTSCAYLTYKSVDKNLVSNFAAYLKSAANFAATQTFHNKSQKNGKSIIGIYFYRG